MTEERRPSCEQIERLILDHVRLEVRPGRARMDGDSVTDAARTILKALEHDTLSPQGQSRDELLARIADVRLVLAGYFKSVERGAQCDHGRMYYEDCIACYDEAIEAALDGVPQARTIEGREFERRNSLATPPSPAPNDHVGDANKMIVAPALNEELSDG